MWTEWEGLRTQNLESKTEFIHSVLSQAESAVMLFERRDRMEGGGEANARGKLNKASP